MVISSRKQIAAFTEALNLALEEALTLAEVMNGEVELTHRALNNKEGGAVRYTLFPVPKKDR